MPSAFIPNDPLSYFEYVVIRVIDKLIAHPDKDIQMFNVSWKQALRNFHTIKPFLADPDKIKADKNLTYIVTDLHFKQQSLHDPRSIFAKSIDAIGELEDLQKAFDAAINYIDSKIVDRMNIDVASGGARRRRKYRYSTRVRRGSKATKTKRHAK